MSKRKKNRKEKRKKSKPNTYNPLKQLAKRTNASVVIPTKGKIAGFALERIPPGVSGMIEACGIHTFDEGLLFYKILDAFNEYVTACNLPPSMIDRMFVIISPENTFIYVNEKFPLSAKCRVIDGCKKGQPLHKDNLAGIERIYLEDFHIPEICGFMLLVSAAWRKGMCFDFRPFAPQSTVSVGESRDMMEKLGGMLLSHLWFTEKFLLTPEEWDKVISNGWFPFVLIPDKCWESLLEAIRHDEDLSSHEEAIHNAFLEKIETRLECWQIHQQLKRHAPFFAEAIDSYRNEKWASCFSVAIPRIEGMLRDAFQLNTIKSSVLLDALGTELRNREHERSLLFPDQLLKFCQKNIYPTTPFDNPDLPSTRHTALHGVVDYSKITRKCALTTLLLVDHLLYCMPLVDSATKGNAETDET